MGGYGASPVRFDLVREQAERELEQRRNLSPKQRRHIKREVRAMQYAHQARNGGGARETERRREQIGSGALRSDNGYV